MADLPTPCPCCGAYSLAPDARVTTLLAVCDVLVVKALETLGKYIVRAERARFNVLGDRPFCEAHTIWAAPDTLVDKALRGTWDVVPLLVQSHGVESCTGDDVVCMLGEYVHDLAVSGHPHTLDDLAYRFDTRLGLPIREAAWT